MDKIKILAAVFALAGCMENGFGMQENIEINNGNVILHSADTSEWNSKISKAGFPELKSIELRGIDFDEYSNLSGLNAVIGMFNDVTFTECKNFPLKVCGLHNVQHITFFLCNDSLDDLSMMVYRTCDFERLKDFTYTGPDNKGDGFDCLTDEFFYTKIHLNIQ